MGRRGPAQKLIQDFGTYSQLLGAVGHSVDAAAVAEHLVDDEQFRSQVAGLLAHTKKRANVPPDVAERMDVLLKSLADECRHVADDAGEALPEAPAKLADGLGSSGEAVRDAVGDAVLLNGHRQYIHERHLGLPEFRNLLGRRADKGRFALVKLVPYLRDELARRGLEFSAAQIRTFFDAGGSDGQVPYCLKHILSGVNGEFAAGLIDLADLVGGREPDEWLDEVRERLQFRSHSSMHKAIAACTSLKYDCVHKALSGKKKAKRIQVEIKYCLDAWLQALEEEREPEIPEECRGIPVEKMHELLPGLEQQFDTKEDIYRLISERTGIKTGSVRRYFQSNGQLKYAPLSVFECAQKLAAEGGPSYRTGSYLADKRTRRVARGLAHRLSQAQKRRQAGGKDDEPAVTFKELRRALIKTLKEQRHTAPSL